MSFHETPQPLPDCPIPDLPAALDRLLARIPPGRVVTYGTLAEALGDVRAARWIGERLLAHPHDDRCPCHRVVRRDGSLGLFFGGDVDEKRRRLQADGIAVEDGVVDLARCAVTDVDAETPAAQRPLASLQEFQRELPSRLVHAPIATVPERIAGIDVSYSAGGDAVAAYVLVDTATGDVAWSTTVRRPATFPYLTGYLSFREQPALLAALDVAAAAGRLAAVTLVDGQGILHPRGAGIAAQIGALRNLATIGIGKTHLCGAVLLDDLPPRTPRPVLLDDRIAGVALRNESRHRPFFVSPGQKVDVESATRIALATLRAHRLPEPIFHADRLSRAAARDG